MLDLGGKHKILLYNHSFNKAKLSYIDRSQLR